MDISMIGIDHNLATIEERGLFSFANTEAVEAINNWKETGLFSGCLILSTCNRTELWVSGKQDNTILLTALCKSRNVKADKYQHLAVFRHGEEAVSHLFQMACGIKSQISGEDQILSQIRDALTLARKHHCHDIVIEKVFQTAISAAKKVKTDIKLETTNPSAARNAIELIEEHFGTLNNIECLVIGNGQMGRLVAKMLVKHNARVSMTLRKRFHGKDIRDSNTIVNCRMIEYEDRLTKIDKYQVVIGATKSPHFVVELSDIVNREFAGSLWIDVAVPRDIDPSVGQVNGITLVDMDQLADYRHEEYLQHATDKILEILSEYQEELYSWFAFRNHVDTIKHISKLTKKDTVKRAESGLKHLKSDQKMRHDIQSSIDFASERAVEKLLFGLRDTLPKEHWQKCFSALKTSAEKDTLKR